MDALKVPEIFNIIVNRHEHLTCLASGDKHCSYLSEG